MNKRRHLDFYETGAAAVLALMSRVDLGRDIFEPCAGNGAIVRELERHFYTEDNDVDPKRPTYWHLDATSSSVLDVTQTFDWIVTNPPFNQAFSILRNFRDAGHRCAFLLRLSFLEPTKERGPWLAANPPDGMIVLPRYSFTGDGKTDSVTCAWMIWGARLRFGRAIEIAEREG